MARKMNLGSKTAKADFAALASEKKTEMAQKLEEEPVKTERKTPSPTKLTINIDSKTKRKFKMWCIRHDTNMSDFVISAIEHRDQVLSVIKE